MTYLEEKKKVKRAVLKEIVEMQEKGERVMMASKVWCEFCMTDKKRWEVKLVDPEGAKKLNDPFLMGALEKSEFIMSCEPCIDKNNLTSLKNKVGAKWDGEAEVMKDIYGTK